MAFEAGNSEHLKADRSKHKRIKQRLIAELESAAEDGGTKLEVATRAIVTKAMAGDVQAFSVIADRVDGKPAQAIIGGEEDDAPIRHSLTVKFV